MQGANKGAAEAQSGAGLRIGVVQARFNQDITNRLAEVCLAELMRLEVAEGDITYVTVPGALEVAVALDTMAAEGDFDALIALGCVIRGETYHFELVADQSGAGITRVSLDHHIPIANAILTVENQAQALARIDEKATDAARVAVEMAHLLQELG